MTGSLSSTENMNSPSHSVGSHRRFEELDSLRGIAAMNVVIYHSSALLGIIAALPWLYNTPLQELLAGHQSVIFFFLLSGFVLALPYFDDRAYGYGKFLLRRLCRLYPPYLAAVCFGLVMRILFSRYQISNLWTGPINFGTILQHLVMIDQFSQEPYDPVVWSLVMEMRIAIVFPFIAWMVRRLHWRWSVLIGFFVSVVGVTLHLLYQNNVDFFTNYFDTFHYMFMFIVGAVLAKHRAWLTNAFSRLPIAATLFCFAAAFVIYTWGNEFGSRNWHLAGDLVSDWFTMLAACFFLISALTFRGFRRVLHSRPFLFVGRVSYSIYLFHIVILLVLINLLFYVTSPYVILCLVIAISLVVAAIAHRYIETPSIRLGRLLTHQAVKANPQTSETGLGME